jgi:hypothetical protein
MAIMWPRELPPDVRTNLLRSAECKVYARLEECLDEKYHVFYSRPWLGLNPDGSEVDGECDFVIAHPDKGFLALEVKGGGISYDPRTEKWQSTDRWKFRHNIKNPVLQAMASKHEILKNLKKSELWTSRWIGARHGVIFPDSSEKKEGLAMAMPRSIVCYLEDFEGRFSSWIESRFGDAEDDGGREGSLGNDGVSALTELLARPFRLSVPLGHWVREDDATLRALTTRQYHIIRSLEEVRRAAILGGAGTGKTVLAMHKAVLCAGSGMRTLLVCFNRPLADQMVELLGGERNLEVLTFHGLCRKKAMEAGLDMSEGSGTEEFFRDLLPELLMRAMERPGSSGYDAVIVDEGQDFHSHWWTALDSVFTSGTDELLYVFLDNNQNFYSQGSNLPRDVNLIPIRLSENLRNTRRIHQAVGTHYSGPPVQAIGPEGVPVEWKRVEDGSVSSTLGSYVERLVGQEGVSLSEIAVLFSNETMLEKVLPLGKIAGHAICRFGGHYDDLIVAETVRRFKGLEKPVVVVVADGEFVDNRELAYVALSRARSLLCVIGTREVLEHLTDSSE